MAIDTNFNHWFRYDIDTGKLYWKNKPQRSPIRIGNEVGSIDSQGYRTVRLMTKRYKAHRVVWHMHHGKWPNQIDHINGNRDDNCIENLRSVTIRENALNQAIPQNNTTGISGVCWATTAGKWIVHIHQVHLGYFTDFFEACCARKSAEYRLNYHPNHGRTQ